LKQKYHGRNKIPMQVFHDAYFEGKIEVKGDMLEVLEYRLDWAEMRFTMELFKYVLFKLIPDVLMHTAKQDEEQVRDHYDRESSRQRPFAHVSRLTLFCLSFLQAEMTFTAGSSARR
jgi:hypothetical protein